MNRVHISALLWACLVAVPFSEARQGQPPGIDRIRDQILVETADLRALQLPALPGTHFELSLDLGGQICTLSLAPYRLRSSRFRVLAQGPNGVTVEVPTVPARTYRGTVKEVPGSIVAASLLDTGLVALVRLDDGDVWGIQPASAIDPSQARSMHAVYRQTDASEGPWTCSAGQLSFPMPTTPGGPEVPPAGSPCKIVEIAFDSDYEFYTFHGGDYPAIVDDVETLMNGAEAIYYQDVGVTFEIGLILFKTTPAIYPSTDPLTLLEQFRQYWIDIFPGELPDVDVAHLMTGKDLDGSVVGIAYFDGICNTVSGGKGFGLSQTHFTANFAYRVALTAHELGHNFSADHCNGQPDCGIMCATIGSCSGNVGGFGASERSQIIAFKDSVPCLTTCLDVVYVDAGHTGFENGTQQFPFNTIAEALDVVTPFGQIVITSNSYPGSYQIDIPVTLQAIGGPVTIGG